MPLKNIILFLLITLLTSCSIFQSKYVTVESTNGECYDEYFVDLQSNEVVEKESPYSVLRIEFIERELYSQNTEGKSFPYASVKLNGQFFNYEGVNNSLDSQLNLRIKPDIYEISLFSTANHIDLNKKLPEKIQVHPNEIRKIVIVIKKQTTCVSYSVKEKILRSEWRKRKKDNQN